MTAKRPARRKREGRHTASDLFSRKNAAPADAGAVRFSVGFRRYDGSLPYREKRTLVVHFLFLLLDHSADHFAADGTGLLGSKVAVLAFL